MYNIYETYEKFHSGTRNSKNMNKLILAMIASTMLTLPSLVNAQDTQSNQPPLITAGSDNSFIVRGIPANRPPAEAEKLRQDAIATYHRNEAEGARLLKEAAREFDAGQYALAERDARKAVSLNTHGREDEIVAASLMAQGKDKEALDQYLDFVNHGDRSPATLLPYALLQLRAGNWQEAIAAYNAALPHLACGQLLAAHSHFDSNSSDTGAIESAIRLAWGLTYSWEAGFSGQPQTGLAETQFKQALVLEPNDGITNLYYGDFLQRHGHRVEAMAIYKKVEAASDGSIKAAATSALHDGAFTNPAADQGGVNR